METKKNSSYYIVIAICGILLGIVFMGQANLYSPMAPVLRENLGLSYTQTSLITTVMNVGSVTATFLIAAVYNKLGVRKGLIVPLVCAVASWLLFCVANNFFLVCVAAFFCQFAFGMGGMMPASLVMNRWFVKKKGLVLGLCSAGSGVAGLVMSAWVARQASEKGIPAAAIVVAIIVAVGGAIIMLLIRNTPEEMGTIAYGSDEGDAGKSKTKKANYVSVKPLSASSKVLMLLAIGCCGFTGFGAIPNFTLAATSKGFDAVFAGGLLGMVGLLAMFGKPLFGILIDNVGPVVANVIYMGMAIAAYILLFFVQPGMEPMLYVVVIIFGLACYSITTIGVPIWAANLCGGEDYAKLLKNFQLASTIGGLVGAPLAGIITDATGNYGFYYLFLGAALVFAMVTIGVMYAKHTRRVRGDEV